MFLGPRESANFAEPQSSDRGLSQETAANHLLGRAKRWRGFSTCLPTLRDRAVIQVRPRNTPTTQVTKRLDFWTAGSELQINLTQSALEILRRRWRVPNRCRSDVHFDAYSFGQLSGHLSGCTIPKLLVTSTSLLSWPLRDVRLRLRAEQ